MQKPAPASTTGDASHGRVPARTARLVTGTGAVALTAPVTDGVSMIQRIISIQSMR